LRAQSAAPSAPAAAATSAAIELPAGFAGPPPPPLPATIARDGNGRTTVRAVRLTAPLRVDGQLDEALYSEIQPLSGFVQAEPDWNAPSTDETHIWISFDNDRIYVSARVLYDDASRIVANEMRRDNGTIFQNDHLTIAIDTFYDQRNSTNFSITALGARGDGQVSNEGNYSGDFNPIWDAAVRRTPDGWTAELAIPFKSIRYQ